MTVGPAAGGGLGFEVTPDNVLGAYAALKEEAERLRLSVRKFQYAAMKMRPCGGDPVSGDAATGFSEACGLLAQRCNASVASLDSRADELAKTARSYGMTEEQITGAFDKKNYLYQPSPILQSGAQR